MQTIVFLLPMLAVIIALASGRTSLLVAGSIALGLSVPAAWVALGNSASLASLSSLLLTGSLRGAWIAWQAVSIILGGLLLYQVLNSARPDLFAARAARVETLEHQWLFTICFLLGPFVEAATGFGVGYLITISALMRMGLGRFEAVVFGLFSQILVPWGALGVGTLIGAELADIPLRDLGVHGAVLSSLLLPGYLLAFWWMLSKVGRAPTIRQCVDDLVWLLALCVLLLATNLLVAVEVAGLMCTAPLLVLRYLRDRKPLMPTKQLANLQGEGGRTRGMAQTVLPYAALTLLLVLTRSVPTVDTFLRELLIIRPSVDLPSFPVFHHASFWLLLVAGVYGAVQLTPRQWAAVSCEVLTSARTPVLVSVVFLMMAEIMSLAGIPAALADAWVSFGAAAAPAASPLLAMLAGALTGSNTASNGMLMVLQVELAARTGADSTWIAALQNVAGSNATLLSPIRVAMGCALVALSGREAEVYRLVWPLALVMLVVLEVTSFVA